LEAGGLIIYLVFGTGNSGNRFFVNDDTVYHLERQHDMASHVRTDRTGQLLTAKRPALKGPFGSVEKDIPGHQGSYCVAISFQ
jgi:hypothetical protein